MPGSESNGVEAMQIDLADDQNDNNVDVIAGGGGAGGNNVAEDFIVDNPTMDLETYINSYTGTAKLLRLIHIADHCPAFRIEALKMAIVHVMTKTFNVALYQQLHKKLLDTVGRPLPDVAGGAGPAGGGGGGGVHVPHGDVPQLDTQWIEQMTKKTLVSLEKLDTDLKNYKSNSIKESIRRGYDDLGEFYLDCGDLMNALKSFTRSRDYCTSAKHVITMCLNVIKVSIYLQNWSHVANFVAKAENTPDPSEEKKGSNSKEITLTASKLKCAAGLAELANRKYKAAAKNFLLISCDHCDFADIVSPNNIAVYAALCALATFERDELQEKVMSSSSFKMFLELEPPIRDVLVSFYESKYGKCLSLLDEMKENLLLDIYMAPHVQSLYSQIRNRGLIQYFRPYASADMSRMAQSFNTTTAQLENELMDLILDGQIQARIDSHNKILIAKNVDERCCTFEKALNMGLEYERKTKLMILRAAILQAQIIVKAPPKENQGPGMLPGTNSNFRSHRDRSDS